MKKLSALAIALLVINIAKAQWQSTPGPYLASAFISMDVSKLAVSSNNLCAIINNRIYLSNNNGASWMYASNGVNYVTSFAFVDSVIYAGGNGVYLSTNWGSTYTPVNNGLPSNTRIDALLVSGNLVLASVHDNVTSNSDVYYTTNNGSAWSLSTGLHNMQTRCFATNGTNLYAGTWNGVYMSTDTGVTWTYIGLNTNTIHALAVEGNRIFAGENSSAGELYLSQNDGVSWTLINAGLSPYIGSIVINNNYVFVGTYWNGVYRSNNNGSSWNSVGIGCSFIDVKTLAIDSNNLFAGSSDGFTGSANQGSGWNCGLKTYNLYIKSIVSPPSGLIAATPYGMYNSPDIGLTWNQHLVTRNALATNDSIVLSGGNGVLYRSMDLGNTWTYVYGIPGSSTVTNLLFKDSLAIAATTGSGVFFSENYGQNWTQRINGLSNLNINALASTDSIVAAGSNNAGIFVSTDSGANWNATNNGLPDTCIQALASYQNMIYAGTRNHGVYKSVDSGANWLQLSLGTADTNITCLYTCGVNIFAGIRGQGFLMSPDNGVNWFPYNNGLMNHNINTITENGTDIFIGTSGYFNDGGGIWKRSISELPLTLSVKAIAVNPKVICEGYSSFIHVTAIGGTSPYSYSWNNGGQTSSITVSPTATTTYTLIVTDSNSNTTTAQVTITVKPAPVTPVITQSHDTLFSSAVNGNVWMLNNAVIFNATSDHYVATQPGIYSVIVIENGCVSDTSNAIQVVGIDEPVNFNSIEIYPNPATNNLTIIAPLKSRIEIFNIQEQLLEAIISDEARTKINLSAFSNGVYFLKIRTDGGIWIRKFIKE